MSNKLVICGETQHRALKLRIYPSNEQKVLIEKLLVVSVKSITIVFTNEINSMKM